MGGEKPQGGRRETTGGRGAFYKFTTNDTKLSQDSWVNFMITKRRNDSATLTFFSVESYVCMANGYCFVRSCRRQLLL